MGRLGGPSASQGNGSLEPSGGASKSGCFEQTAKILSNFPLSICLVLKSAEAEQKQTDKPVGLRRKLVNVS